MKFTLTFEIDHRPEAMSFDREPAATLLEALREGSKDHAPWIDINGVAFFVTRIEETPDPASIVAELRHLD